ncbi:C39 family peptidase [Thermoflexus sp.]|uniref:C39 family peptidase n=1 Tax=Thermoflexus sp. TaxID=1969742 RepID=UPI00260146CB|nr:C39 family peptidase [Thermoflexus sp.]MCS6965113.1 C39 family peptidase [Thermoflexus sp.]MCX7689566.1 C39 family peptidase [Thermoflexus sp.]
MGVRRKWIGFSLLVAFLSLGAIWEGLHRLPPRYVARLVPEPLQPWFWPAHPKEVPTPMATVSFERLAPLLTPGASRPSPTRTALSSPTPSPSPSPAPALPPTSTPSRSIPTPTITRPAFPGPTQAARNTPAALDQADVLLYGVRHAFQTWNNCGPATLAMGLSFYGWRGTQREAAAVLKPNPEDKNVSPEEMAAFARSLGLGARVRVNGDLELLKRLLRAGFPVLIETGFEPDPKQGWMGHYRLLIGYSERAGQFIVMDSYMGPNQGVPYPELDRYWRHFNRTYLVIYPPEAEGRLRELIGPVWDDDRRMWEETLARAQEELAANPQDAFAWFNAGAALFYLGRAEDAATAFDQARALRLPWRVLWYRFEPFEAYLAVGRYADVIALADANLRVTPYVEEWYDYKGQALLALGDRERARALFERALQFNPNFQAARAHLAALSP